MSVTAKLTSFLGALVAAFTVALGIGATVGPATVGPVGSAESPSAGGHGMTTAGGPTEGSAATHLPKGLMASQDGYTFRLRETTASAGSAVPVAFTIEGPDGGPVTEYDVEHEKRLHLIAVRRDFTGYQHVHPGIDAEGTWSTPLDLTPGQWRLFADFKARGAEALTLGSDLAVPGRYAPAAPAAESRTATVDGYTVTLDGDLTAGEDATLTFTVSRGGDPVTDLEPYLGAYGHLVALRAGDLAYLHVHPEGTPGDGTTEPGPGVVFVSEVPSRGGYRLYLDFKHRGVVRTAAFTVSASGTAAPQAAEPREAEPQDGHSGGGH